MDKFTPEELGLRYLNGTLQKLMFREDELIWVNIVEAERNEDGN